MIVIKENSLAGYINFDYILLQSSESVRILFGIVVLRHTHIHYAAHIYIILFLKFTQMTYQFKSDVMYVWLCCLSYYCSVMCVFFVFFLFFFVFVSCLVRIVAWVSGLSIPYSPSVFLRARFGNKILTKQVRCYTFITIGYSALWC
jgi:hypothetical protein